MPYLIDGHNLIPKIPGIDLDDIDDEEQLIKLLQQFTRNTQKKVELYFDQAPPGHPQRKSLGRLSVIFVRQGRTADAAIRKRLKSLQKKAKNWTVVSSDHEVQAAARGAQARVLSADQFSHQLTSSPDFGEDAPPPQKPQKVDQDELTYWLKQFGEQ
jgi:hypothetical protein